MRLSNRAEMSISLPCGTPAVGNQSTVGSDISSATQGSSITSVAGKNRAPTKQCAKALDSGSETNKRPIASAHACVKKRDMANFPSVEEAISAAGAVAAGPARRSLLVHLHHAAVVHHHGAAGGCRGRARSGSAYGGDRKVDFDRSRLLESQRRFNRF